VAPTAGPSPTLHSLRAKHTISKDLPKPVLRRMIERVEGGNKKIKIKNSLQQTLLGDTIHE
jgi:hypothetical protein